MLKIQTSNFDKKLFDPIKDILTGKKFVYFRNPGNYGDSLIREGTLRFFNENYFDFVSINHVENESIFSIKPSLEDDRKTFVFGGGGAWHPLYFERTKKIIQSALEIFDEVIVLPSTYQKFDEFDQFVSTLDRQKIHFFRRDEYISKEALPDSICVPDMALYIEYVRVLKSQGSFDVGYMFRKDAESKNVAQNFKDNFDISATGDDQTEVLVFFNYIYQFKKIYTDRLHVAIAGVLLGKEVFLYDNSYGKNKSFYDTFLRDVPHIKFLD